MSEPAGTDTTEQSTVQSTNQSTAPSSEPSSNVPSSSPQPADQSTSQSSTSSSADQSTNQSSTNQSSTSSYNPPQPPIVKKDSARVYSTHPPSWTKPPSSKSRDLLLEMFKDPAGKPVLETLKCGKKQVHSFGRHAEQCTHTCDHTSISRQHAAIMHNSNAAYVVDLYSSQGTLLNNVKLVPGEPHILRNGDVIQFGQSSRRYRVRGLRYDNKRSASESSEQVSKRSKNEIQASHILIKHAGSRRPSSHREPNITRTRDEAAETLRGLHKQLLEAAAKSVDELRTTFSNLANDHSDCSSFKRGGDLGKFTADKMQAEFSSAAFALDVNGLSDIVDSQSGVHLILRTA